MRFHYIRDIVESGEISVLKIHTSKYLADMLTKPLPAPKFVLCIDLVFLFVIPRKFLRYRIGPKMEIVKSSTNSIIQLCCYCPFLLGSFLLFCCTLVLWFQLYICCNSFLVSWLSGMIDKYPMNAS